MPALAAPAPAARSGVTTRAAAAAAAAVAAGPAAPAAKPQLPASTAAAPPPWALAVQPVQHQGQQAQQQGAAGTAGGSAGGSPLQQRLAHWRQVAAAHADNEQGLPPSQLPFSVDKGRRWRGREGCSGCEAPSRALVWLMLAMAVLPHAWQANVAGTPACLLPVRVCLPYLTACLFACLSGILFLSRR